MARTSNHRTDIARVIGAPVLHVNADDVDALVRAALIAADYRHVSAPTLWSISLRVPARGHTEIDEPLSRSCIEKSPSIPTVRDRDIARVVADGVRRTRRTLMRGNAVMSSTQPMQG